MSGDRTVIAEEESVVMRKAWPVVRALILMERKESSGEKEKNRMLVFLVPLLAFSSSNVDRLERLKQAAAHPSHRFLYPCVSML